jgi:uncharacterized protein YpmB
MPIVLVIVIPILWVIIRFAWTMWKMKRAYKQAFKNATNTQQQHGSWTNAGDVKIVRTEQAEQRVSDNVGEYVDFQEIKEDKK